MNNAEIKEGQVWTYRYRAGEEQSRVTIIKADNLSGNPIVHIRINNLKLINRVTGRIIGDHIEHLPIDLKVFKESVCELESVANAVVSDGYWVWKEEFDAGKAGVWAVGLSEVIDLIEVSLNQS